LPDAGIDKNGCPRRGDPVAELIDECEKDGVRTELFHQVCWVGRPCKRTAVCTVRVGWKKREVHEVGQGSGWLR
jgi:hypothetical protein